MAITINQTAFNSFVGLGSITATLTSAVAQGDTLVALIGMGDSPTLRTVSSVTDSAGNAWAKVPNAYGTGGNAYSLDIWVATNVKAAASLTVTATISGTDGSAAYDLAVFDVSACSVETEANNSTTLTTGASYSGPSVSSPVAALYLAGFVSVNGHLNTVSSPWTQAGGGNVLSVGYVSSSGMQQPVWNLSSNAAAVCSVVVLYVPSVPASSGGGFPPPEYGYGYGQAPQAAKPAPAPKFYSGGWSLGKPPGPVFDSGGNK